MSPCKTVQNNFIILKNLNLKSNIEISFLLFLAILCTASMVQVNRQSQLIVYRSCMVQYRSYLPCLTFKRETLQLSPFMWGRHRILSPCTWRSLGQSKWLLFWRIIIRYVQLTVSIRMWHKCLLVTLGIYKWQ